MNNSSYDDFEEVESPFAPKSSGNSSPSRDKLRSRKNVFNRPFATASSNAPIVLETKSTKRSLGHGDFGDLVERRKSELSETEIEYLDEDEVEVEEKRPAVRSSTKKSSKTKKNLLPKLAWSVIGLLVLRLIFMDRGVWDYFATEGTIKEKRHELKSIQNENKSLRAEITRLQVDKGYQRQLAKEHLGVIAADEFLILFAGESAETNSNPAQF